MPSPRRSATPDSAAEALRVLEGAADALCATVGTTAMSIELDVNPLRDRVVLLDRALPRDASAHQRMAMHPADKRITRAMESAAEAWLADIQPRFEGWSLRYARNGQNPKPYLRLTAGAFVIDGTPSRTLERITAFAAALRAAIPDPRTPCDRYRVLLHVSWRADPAVTAEAHGPDAAAAAAVACAHQLLTAPAGGTVRIQEIARLLPDPDAIAAAAARLLGCDASDGAVPKPRAARPPHGDRS